MITAMIVAAACSWNEPGADPFQGNRVLAVDSYTEFDSETRAVLKQKILTRNYDDFAVITADAIEGNQEYYPQLEKMHFGKNKLCATVDRSQWMPQHKERGLVYCHKTNCLIIPTVCGNVSKVFVKNIKQLPTMGGVQSSGPLPLLGIATPTETQQMKNLPEVLPLVNPPALSWTEMAQPFGNSHVFVVSPPIPVIPEPATWLLLAMGIVCIAAYKKFAK